MHGAMVLLAVMPSAMEAPRQRQRSKKGMLAPGSVIFSNRDRERDYLLLHQQRPCFVLLKMLIRSVPILIQPLPIEVPSQPLKRQTAGKS